MEPNAADLDFLETLKQADPPIIIASRGAAYMVAGSIPLAVLEEVETLDPPIKYYNLGNNWCLRAMDWLSCRERLITKYMQRMARRSLEIGLIGPTPLDLEKAPTLSPWIAVSNPRSGAPILVGTQSGHPAAIGPLISTSRICGIDAAGTWARTASRWYRLKDPATSEALVAQMSPMLAGLDVIALELWQVQAFIAEELVREGICG